MKSIIPARGGSKGVPGKNIKKIKGMPLLAYPIISAQKTKYITEVYVSTDDESIKEVALSYGAKVIDRPSEFAQDDSLDIDVMRHAVEYLDDYGDIVHLRATTPMIESNVLDDAIDYFLQNDDCTGMRSAHEAPETAYKSFKKSGDYWGGLFDHQLEGDYYNLPRQSTGVPLLYESSVRHTTLGLDLATRILHKFTGHLYTNHIYTQIFVHGLGENSMSFDGFSLLDASLLHGQEQIFRETPVHLLQIQAYLYSWLVGALPLDSVDCDFVYHGIIGLLLQIYIEQLFGKYDANCRIQKMNDIVLDMDMSGRGGALGSDFPSNYEHLTLEWKNYVKSKSTMLLLMLERVLEQKHFSSMSKLKTKERFIQ